MLKLQNQYSCWLQYEKIFTHEKTAITHGPYDYTVRAPLGANQ